MQTNKTNTTITLDGVIVKAEERQLSNFRKADYLVRCDFSTPNGPFEAHYPVERRLRDGDHILAEGTPVVVTARVRAYEGRSTGRWFVTLDAYAIEARAVADEEAGHVADIPKPGDDPMPF